MAIVASPAWAMVGDVHGDVRRLTRALDVLASTERNIIFLGDYVNRGPDSRAVLEVLADASEGLRHRLTLLRGNHDDALLQFLKGLAPSIFLSHGGLGTIASYDVGSSRDALADFRLRFPPRHKALLESTTSFVDTEWFFASHTGYDPLHPDDRSVDCLVRVGHPGIFQDKGAAIGKLVVCGHYVQRDGHPLDLPSLVALDTGCGTLKDGPLTALMLPEREFLQF